MNAEPAVRTISTKGDHRMNISTLTKLSLAAAAATMLTLSPALAHGSRGHHGHGYHGGHSYNHGHGYHHGKHRYGRHYKRHRHYGHGHRHWKPRFHNAWRYGNRHGW